MARLLIVRTGLASLVALAACSSGGSPSGTARGSSPTTAPSTATVVAARLGAPPSCPGASVPIGTAGPYGEVVGRSPLWGGFYADVDRDAGTFAAPDAPRTASGWRIKVLWVMRAGQESAVTIRGADTETGAALWFDPDDYPAGPVATLDPAHPGAGSENPGWLNYPSYLFFPGSGCFRLTVSSRDGGLGDDLRVRGLSSATVVGPAGLEPATF
ncbi:MAG TPA: hypothetical protein VEO00_10670 [Actinomycetota bacterium]|nr:hypothetical protein [Actinomycetota bacterium]